MRVAIYECDWYSAPIPFRKLVLNVLTRCSHETLFRANPFYDLDLLLLTRVGYFPILAIFKNLIILKQLQVVKATYTLIAVFGNALK